MIHILIAGRDRSSLSAFKIALDESDTLTTYLDTGSKALSAVTGKRFDLLVADEGLRDMSGLELCRGKLAFTHRFSRSKRRYGHIDAVACWTR